MKKMMSGLIAALIVVLGLAVAPTAAQAHTGDMNISAVCNTATGQYDLTATLTTANTRLAGQTQWRVGSERFEGTPSSNSGMTSGPVASQGAQTITLGSFSLPGSTIGHGPWVYAFTTWTDGFTKGSDGQLLQPLAGDCKIPDPPFEGVTKYTPNYSATCEAATFSHPAIKTGFGIANVYGVRYGSTQAEAQAKPFDSYVPGSVVTMPFADPYIGNGFYFELKVGYDGANLTHQIGQTRGTSEACDRPVPEQPAALTGEETRDLAPICIVPADGTAEVVHEKRTWEQPYDVWNVEAWEWQLGEKTFSEWEVSGSMIVDFDDCAVETPPSIDPPKSPVKPQEIQTGLANTGFVGTTVLASSLIIGSALLISGLVIAVGAAVSRRAES